MQLVSDSTIRERLRPQPGSQRNPWSGHRRRWGTILGTVLLVLAIGGGGVGAYGYWWAGHEFGQIPTFEQITSTPLNLASREPQQPRTYLIFSVGSANMTQEQATRYGIGDLRERGADGLTDVIGLLVIDPGARRSYVISIPRDTWIDDGQQKINALYNRHGPQALADAVTELTGVPVQRMLGVNFAGFANLVDLAGGVNVGFDHPTRDRATGLNIPEAGCVHLDGPGALRWLRSRNYQIQGPDGRWRTPVDANDISRISHQQQFTQAMTAKLGDPSNLGRIPALLRDAQHQMIRDSRFDLAEARQMGTLLVRAGTSNITFLTIPHTFGNKGQAAVVIADRARTTEALRPVTDLFGTSTPAATASTPGNSTTPDPTPAPGHSELCAPA